MKKLSKVLCLAAAALVLSASPAVASETTTEESPICALTPPDGELPRYAWRAICPPEQ